MNGKCPDGRDTGHSGHSMPARPCLSLSAFIGLFLGRSKGYFLEKFKIGARGGKADIDRPQHFHRDLVEVHLCKDGVFYLVEEEPRMCPGFNGSPPPSSLVGRPAHKSNSNTAQIQQSILGQQPLFYRESPGSFFSAATSNFSRAELRPLI